MIPDIHLYHAPGTRSERVKLLLDRLEFDYRLTVVNQAEGTHKTPEYREINPFGTLPGLTLDGEPVVESAAQILVLADLDPQGRLAPKITDPARARYVHWLVTVPVSLEPMVMPIFNRIPTPGTAQKIKSALEIQTKLFEGPYCVGHHLTAADIFLHWGLRLMASKGALKDAPFWLDYLQRLEPELSWATLHPTKPGFLDDAGSVHIT